MMIGLNEIVEFPGESQLQTYSRHNRIPEHYKSNIKELTKPNSIIKEASERSQIRTRNVEHISPFRSPTTISKVSVDDSLECVLPKGGRRLQVKVIISKNRIKKVKKEGSENKNSTPVKQEGKNENLLDVLIKLCEEEKVQTISKSLESSYKSTNDFKSMRENYEKEKKKRGAKQDLEKYNYMYHKYQYLNEKLEQLDNETTIL